MIEELSTPQAELDELDPCERCEYCGSDERRLEYSSDRKVLLCSHCRVPYELELEALS